jgi:Glycosyl hydrolase family 63 N-terminal domain
VCVRVCVCVCVRARYSPAPLLPRCTPGRACVFSPCQPLGLGETCLSVSSQLACVFPARAQVLFGLRTRSATPLSTGLLWTSTPTQEPHRFIRERRYTCEQGRDLSYSWQEHDGRTYGKQKIVDSKHNLQLTTSFVKLFSAQHSTSAEPLHSDSNSTGHWRVLIEGKRARGSPSARTPATTAPVSLFFVVSNEDLSQGTLRLLHEHPEVV